MSKNEFQLAVLALIQEVDPEFNPIKQMVELAKTGSDDAIRLSANKELASYLYPKQRPVDKDGKSDKEIHISILSFGGQQAIATAPGGVEVAIGRVLDPVPLPEPDEEVIDGDYTSG